MLKNYTWTILSNVKWHKIENPTPTYPFRDADVKGMQSELGIIIEQTFDTRYDFLYYYELDVVKPFSTQVESLGDCHLIFHLTDIPLQLTLVDRPDSEPIHFQNKAQICYTPAGKYQIYFPIGKHIISGFIFDIGIVRESDFRSYDYILPVQDAWRRKCPIPVCTPLFRIGPLSLKALFALYSQLVQNLDMQHIMVKHVVYFLKLSRIKLLEEDVQTPRQKIDYARELFALQIAQNGAKARVSEIALSMDIHVDKLSKLHRQYYNTTFLTYRNELLLQQVIPAIRQYGKLIEVALECGFGGINELNQFVKNQTGHSSSYFK